MLTYYSYSGLEEVGVVVVVVVVYLTSCRNYGARAEHALCPRSGHQRSPGASQLTPSY